MTRLTFGAPALRCGLVAIALVGAIGIGGQTALADTSTETGVIVTIVDEGSLDIAWAGSGTPFLVDGEAPELNATTPTVTATSTFSLVVSDTRPDDTRTGYAISIAAQPFTAEGSRTAIGPEMLSIVGVSGLPGGGMSSLVATLDAPVTILSVADGEAAVSTTLTITIAMTLTPGMIAGNYAGGITFDVIPTGP